MAAVTKFRRILMTGTLSVAIASGALYGASLKMNRDAQQEAQKRQNLTTQEKIDALLVVREELMRKKGVLETQIRDVDERERRRREQGRDAVGAAVATPGDGRDGNRGRGSVNGEFKS